MAGWGDPSFLLTPTEAPVVSLLMQAYFGFLTVNSTMKQVDPWLSLL